MELADNALGDISDTDSHPARKTMETLGVLGLEIGASLKLKSTSTLGQQKTIDFLSKLLGNETWALIWERVSAVAGTVRIFHTVSMNVASIALAASANGADIAV